MSGTSNTVLSITTTIQNPINRFSRHISRRVSSLEITLKSLVETRSLCPCHERCLSAPRHIRIRYFFLKYYWSLIAERTTRRDTLKNNWKYQKRFGASLGAKSLRHFDLRTYCTRRRRSVLNFNRLPIEFRNQKVVDTRSPRPFRQVGRLGYGLGGTRWTPLRGLADVSRKRHLKSPDPDVFKNKSIARPHGCSELKCHRRKRRHQSSWQQRKKGERPEDEIDVEIEPRWEKKRWSQKYSGESRTGADFNWRAMCGGKEIRKVTRLLKTINSSARRIVRVCITSTRAIYDE